MAFKVKNISLPRRGFLHLISSSLAISVFNTSYSEAISNKQESDSDDWLNKIKGKHRMVFDTVTPFNGFQVVWPLTFLETYNQRGIIDGDLNAIVVFRNRAVSMALSDSAWKKYKLGKFYKVTDPTFNADADRNLYWNPPSSEMPEEGSSIKELMGRGVLFCVCEKALTLNSAQVAKNKNLDPTMVKTDWLNSLLPGIQLVPSGVWAINEAQEKGASYCYAN